MFASQGLLVDVCGQVDLWKTSGHIDFYRDSMFNQMDVDAEEYQACFLQAAAGCMTTGGAPSCARRAGPTWRFSTVFSAARPLGRSNHSSGLAKPHLCLQLKPMNCPFHISVYKQGYYSYRDLPIRWAELGTGEHAKR